MVSWMERNLWNEEFPTVTIQFCLSLLVIRVLGE